MAIDRTVPSERNNTYAPEDVHRKTFLELLKTAFNMDQRRCLEIINARIPVPEESDNGKYLVVQNGVYALAGLDDGTEEEY